MHNLTSMIQNVAVGVTSGTLVGPSETRLRLILLESNNVYFVQPGGSQATVAGSIPVVRHILLEGYAAQQGYTAIASVATQVGVIEVHTKAPLPGGFH